MRGDSKEMQEFASLLIDPQEVIRSFIITQIPGSPDLRDILQEVNMVLWERRPHPDEFARHFRTIRPAVRPCH